MQTREPDVKVWFPHPFFETHLNMYSIEFMRNLEEIFKHTEYNGRCINDYSIFELKTILVQVLQEREIEKSTKTIPEKNGTIPNQE